MSCCNCTLRCTYILCRDKSTLIAIVGQRKGLPSQARPRDQTVTSSESNDTVEDSHRVITSKVAPKSNGHHPLIHHLHAVSQTAFIFLQDYHPINQSHDALTYFKPLGLCGTGKENLCSSSLKPCPNCCRYVPQSGLLQGPGKELPSSSPATAAPGSGS